MLDDIRQRVAEASGDATFSKDEVRYLLNLVDDRTELCRLISIAKDERDSAEERLEALDPTYIRDHTRQGKHSLDMLRGLLEEALDWCESFEVGGMPPDSISELRATKIRAAGVERVERLAELRELGGL